MSDTRNTVRLLLCGMALTTAAAGCKPAVDRSSSPGGASNTRTHAVKRQVESAARDAVKNVGEAAAKANPPQGAWTRIRNTVGFPAAVAVTTAAAQAAPPMPAPERLTGFVAGGPVIRERVSSALPHEKSAEAEEDALLQARRVIADRLAELSPPIRHTPPLGAVKDHYVKKGSWATRPPNDAEREAFKSANLPPNLVYGEYTVEVTDDHLRQAAGAGPADRRPAGAGRAVRGLRRRLPVHPGRRVDPRLLDELARPAGGPGRGRGGRRGADDGIGLNQRPLGTRRFAEACRPTRFCEASRTESRHPFPCIGVPSCPPA